MMKTLSNIKRIVIAVVVVILAFLLIKGCGDKTAKAGADIEKLRDSLIAYQTDNGWLQVEVNRLEAQADELRRDSAEAKAKLRQTSGDLSAAQRRVAILTARVNTGIANRDTPQVINDCGDLAKEADNLSKQVDTYESIIEDLNQILDQTIFNRDEQIAKLKEQLDNCDRVAQYVETQLPKIQKAVKAKTQFYVGGSVYGWYDKPVAGVLAEAGLVNKKGQIYEAGYGNINGNPYLKAGIKFRLSFKK